MSKYGATAACEACTQLSDRGRVNIPLSGARGHRLMELLQGNDDGRAWIEAQKKRVEISTGKDVNIGLKEWLKKPQDDEDDESLGAHAYVMIELDAPRRGYIKEDVDGKVARCGRGR